MATGTPSSSAAFARAFDGQREPAWLVPEKRVGPRHVEDQLRTEHLESGAVPAAEAVQVFVIGHAIVQVNVEAGGRLMRGVVVVLVNRERKHRSIAGEDGRGAVAVMDVAIDHHGALDEPIALRSEEHTSE